MKKKLLYWIIGIIVLLAVIFLLLRGFNGGEDNWIKDEKGIWTKHGNPSDIPNEVKEQQAALACANNLYNQAKQAGIQFNSQCLGSCDDYSIDIVNVPRTSEDNLIENQCSDFNNRITHKFIELDKNGNIVRIS